MILDNNDKRSTLCRKFSNVLRKCSPVSCNHVLEIALNKSSVVALVESYLI